MFARRPLRVAEACESVPSTLHMHFGLLIVSHSARSTECDDQPPDACGMRGWYTLVCCGLSLTHSAASSWTARRSSVVVVAIDLACAGVAHKARGALSGLSGRRHGRWCRVRARSSARRRRRPDLFQPYVTLLCAHDAHATSRLANTHL